MIARLELPVKENQGFPGSAEILSESFRQKHIGHSFRATGLQLQIRKSDLLRVLRFKSLSVWYHSRVMAKYWLMKSEPHVYSIDDLARDGSTHWDGVRNYQARNFMRDEMKQGDRVLYYHSNTKPTAIVGTAEVVRESYPDFTAFDSRSNYHDPKSNPDSPRWFMVDIAFLEKFPHPVTLEEIKKHSSLQDMVLVKSGRLSVQPVKPEEYDVIVQLGQGK